MPPLLSPRASWLYAALVALASASRAELPPPPKDLVDFPVSYAAEAPGAMSADGLLDKPAGRLGPVVAKDGHFYTGDRRIRFWGVNLCFTACFPTHEQADQVAARLARFGVNAVRFHHMDMFKWPGGIFADDGMEELSPDALDRLDYFVAALKKRGVYSNLNLHVSRSYAKVRKLRNADKLPEGMDKLVGLFHPEIIEADRRYAKALLTHVNAYTNVAYAAEPAVCMVEVNNENTLFFWGGEQLLAKLPEPYAGMFKQRWNEWLAKKYTTTANLAAVWDAGAEPRGPNVVRDPGLASLNQNGSPYTIESHGTSKMTISRVPSDHIPLAKFDVTAVDGTDWHLQFGQAGLKVKKGQFYTLSFRCRTDGPKQISVGVSQAHAPWQNLGLTTPVKLYPQDSDQYYGFAATADDDNARISFSLGGQAGTIYLGNLRLFTGGQTGLDKLNEDPLNGTVHIHAPGDSWSAPRAADWYDFVQQTDEAYFVGARDYLKKELKLVAPVTGTIGLGPLGTLGQSKMDFVDAHAYWDHPTFPNHDWSSINWLIKNKPMVDDPAGATLWGLAATRVAGRPFTVTEYNHSAPNEWQAECVPMIATYAALQDWDAVYLFAYSHNDDFEKTHAKSFFDIEGNWLKMAAMPLGARIFLGDALLPQPSRRTLRVDKAEVFPRASASYYDTWKYVRSAAGKDAPTWQDLLDNRFAIHFDPQPPAAPAPPPGETVQRVAADAAGYAHPAVWASAAAPGTGLYSISWPRAAALIGFPGAKGRLPVDLGGVEFTKIDSHFASILLVPADPTKTLKEADRLLLCALGRSENPGQAWNEKRTSLGNKWGAAPPRVEVIRATLTLPADYTVRALDGAGKPVKEFRTTDKTLTLGDAPTVWYELNRR